MLQLNRLLLAALLALATLAPATGQSLSPMRKTGPSPTDTKGFKVVVGNPYEGRMTFNVTPMDPTFTDPVPDAVAKPARITLAPGHSRSVIIAFKIGPQQKERTIGLCITPELDGPIQPRVCGTYTGVRVNAGAGR